MNIGSSIISYHSHATFLLQLLPLIDILPSSYRLYQPSLAISAASSLSNLNSSWRLSIIIPLRISIYCSPFRLLRRVFAPFNLLIGFMLSKGCVLGSPEMYPLA